MMEWLIPIIICVLVGVILLVVEMYMPGFGIPGVSGTLLLIAGVVMAWVEYSATVGLGLAVIVLAVLGILISLTLKSAENGRFAKSLVLHEPKEDDSQEHKDKDMQALLGQTGECKTPLRPVGTAEFACGRLSVCSDGEFIENGTKVRISHIVGTTIYVTKA